MANRMSTLAGAFMAAGIAAVGYWAFQRGTEGDENPATQGVVVLDAPVADIRPPSPAGAAGEAATVPAPPATLIAHVRQAFPLLLDVDFGCDSRGCAVTATIPPPTGEAFLRKRQEMLVGGLAQVAESHGYAMLGPVQMDEVDDNLFHIRASVVENRRR